MLFRSDLIVSDETSAGDTWYAEITPNDGTQDGATVTSNNITIEEQVFMNISITITPNETTIDNLMNVTGDVTLTNGTYAAYVLINISVTNSTGSNVNISIHWYENTSSSYNYYNRFPVVFESVSGVTNETVNITGADLLTNTPSLDLAEINTSYIIIVEPNETATNEVNGKEMPSTVYDLNSDTYFNETDYVEFNITIAANAKKLIYLYE